MQKRYDNGELITKDRMEDEDWYYSMYQPFLEFVCFSSKSTTVEGIMQDVLDSDYIGDAFQTPEQQERLLRWCVLYAERRVSPHRQCVHPNPKFDFKQIHKILSNCKDLEEAMILFESRRRYSTIVNTIWTKLLK